jgi:hypothetical protein
VILDNILMEMVALPCAVTAHQGISVLIQGIGVDGELCICLIERVEHRIFQHAMDDVCMYAVDKALP